MSFFRGEKPYDCNICNKSFSDPSARRRHVASHSGKKPFTCSFCSLSFTRLDNLKTHTKSHNKERAATPEASPDAADAAAAAPEEVRSILQLQQYQLPCSSQQEIQLVVTGDVDNINFVPGQNQEISIIATEGDAADSAHPRLTLLAQSSHQNVALVTQGGVVDQSPHIQTLSMLEGQMTHQPEQMHVITLSKEAMEHLQAHHGPPQPLQMAQRPVQQLQLVHQPIQHLAVAQDVPQGPVSREQHGQAIHISSQSSQPNYPCSLLVLSKHPFFFTAPHKGPFDIFLMESAKPTFGSKRPPFPAPHNPVKKHTCWLQTDKLAHRAACPT